MKKKVRILARSVVSPTQGRIENGSLTLENGIITSLDATPPKGKASKEEVIDFSSYSVYPGFVEAHGHITIVGDTTGSINSDGNDPYDSITPHLSIRDSINLDSPELRGARSEGILAVAIFPGSASLIGGLGTVIKTTSDSLIVDDVIVEPTVGLKMAFGENPKRVFSSEKRFYTRMGALGFLRDYFTATINYRKKKEQQDTKKKKGAPEPDINLKYEVGIRLLNREFPARAHAHQANDIQNAIRLSREFGFDIIIEHGTEADLISDYIKQHDVPVVIGPVGTPGLKIETRRRSFASAGKLADQGIVTAIMTDAPVVSIGFLRLLAGLSIKAGMSYENALKAITSTAAGICRIGDRYGDITSGMPAHLVVWEGDPLRDIDARVVACIDENTILQGDKIESFSK